MLRLLLVALGGALGSSARYGLNGLVSERAVRAGSWLPIFPFGTLVVNISGCLVIGFLAAISGPSLEIVDRAEKIDAFLPELDAMVGDGLITLEKVRVIRYRAGEKK